MQALTRKMQAKAKELLDHGKVQQVLAWYPGEFFYDNSPATFRTKEDCKNIIYNEFCHANLSKYLIEANQNYKKTAIFVKPCDTYGVNQLIKDNRVNRKIVYAVGTPCSGMIDIRKIRAMGVKGIKSVNCEGNKVIVHTVYGDKKLSKSETLFDKCAMCKGNTYAICDEELDASQETPHFEGDPFAEVKAIEAMTPEERFSFWQQELSKCIRCNACRDVCPACNCEQCIFDKTGSPVAGKAHADEAEENMFHIIRAFHVAGRCVGCGECSRVCPQGIRLDLLNKKFIKDINEFYGPYQAGADSTTKATQFTYTTDDVETEVVEAKRRE